MFRATFLGNHGWLLSSESTHLLVDPLFYPRYGLTDAVELRVFPPRRLSLESFPEIDAVFLTHEHEGHFDIPSLHLLARDIPIYLPTLSSLSMRRVLEEMGFTVKVVAPGEQLSIGDLTLLTFAAEQESAVGEEWDNLPYLVYDQAGHGSFFTHVDVRPTELMWQKASEVLSSPGLWAYSNNYSQWHFSYSWASPEPHSLYQLVEWIFTYHKQMRAEWAAPEAVLWIGGGFSFGGDREWVNREVFPCSSEDAARIFSLLLPKEKSFAPTPGATYTMKEGKLVDVQQGCEFLSALPREEWPIRAHEGKISWLEGYTPATQKSALTQKELQELSEELNRFAAFLYGQEPFRRLYSLTKKDFDGKKPTFALVLLADEEGGAYLYEYDPRGCCFCVASSEDPVAEYLYVYECFASDMLAFLQCKISSASLSLGRSRQWMADLELFDLDYYLMLYNHPLRQPRRVLSTYRETAAKQEETIQIFGKEVPHV